jgi:predicted transposase/invertase (TIGR01784 family)
MARYLDPKNDLTFRRIFGEHPELLINFLNAVMPLEPDRMIVEVEYLPADLMPDNPTKKYSLVDVRCRDNYKRQFIVEMQMYWDKAFYSRIVFNAGKAYVRQLDRSEDFNLLQPVYTLALLNENFDHKTEQFYHHYQIVNRENTDEVIPGLEFVLVELLKFRPETVRARKLMVLWLRFLKEVGENMRALPPEMQENEYIRKAAELCEEAAFTPEELAAYDKYWDIIRTEKTLIESAWQKGLKKGLAEGEIKGEKKGLKKGLAEGEIKGLEKGKAEGKAEAKIETVINAHKAGCSIDTIVAITDLTPQQITEILIYPDKGREQNE